MVTNSNKFFGPSGKLFNFGNEAFYKYINSDETDIIYVKGKSRRRDDFRITIDIPNQKLYVKYNKVKRVEDVGDIAKDVNLKHGTDLVVYEVDDTSEIPGDLPRMD